MSETPARAARLRVAAAVARATILAIAKERGLQVAPEGVWWNGHRVPQSGYYLDDHGHVTLHEAHATFASCPFRRRECAFRMRVVNL